MAGWPLLHMRGRGGNGDDAADVEAQNRRDNVSQESFLPMFRHETSCLGCQIFDGLENLIYRYPDCDSNGMNQRDRKAA